jgi:hypothetical protein
MKDDDFEAMLANLKLQKVDDVVVIELSSGTKYDVSAGKASRPDHKIGGGAAAKEEQARPATAPGAATHHNPNNPDRQKGYNPRREPGGASTIKLW